MLSESGQSQRTTYYIIPLILNVQNRHINRDRQQISGCQELGGQKNGKDAANRYEVPFWGDADVWKQIVVIVQLYEYTKIH